MIYTLIEAYFLSFDIVMYVHFGNVFVYCSITFSGCCVSHNSAGIFVSQVIEGMALPIKNTVRQSKLKAHGSFILHIINLGNKYVLQEHIPIERAMQSWTTIPR